MNFTPMGLETLANLLHDWLTLGINMDSKLILSSAQAQTSVASHDSTYALDFGAANPNLGTGTPLWLTVAVQTQVTGGTSGSTLQLKVQDAADGSTYATLFETSIMNAAGLGLTSTFVIAAGTKLINQPLPAAVRRYLKVVYVIGTAVLSAGKWDAYVNLGGA
jgi:Bbp16